MNPGFIRSARPPANRFCRFWTYRQSLQRQLVDAHLRSHTVRLHDRSEDPDDRSLECLNVKGPG